MIDLFQDALELQQFCDAQGWSYCIIGGLAVQRWSEVRATRDVDLALLTGFGREEPFIDISLAALPFEEEAIRRATLYAIAPGIDLRTCSAEDLMVFKLFASRAIDLRDAEGIAVRNAETLDWNYVETRLAPLAELKEAPEIMQTLARIRRGEYISW